MSEKTRDVLLDSNAYFRLAPSVHPLLKATFGQPPQYSLHVLAELDDEYSTSTRLRHKFEWVRNAEYRQDRQAKRYELRGQARMDALTPTPRRKPTAKKFEKNACNANPLHRTS